MAIPFVDLAAMHAEVVDELDEAWQRTRLTSQFVGGPSVDAFEEQWAAYCRVRHCVGVSSGTAALELVLRALGIGFGSEVIVPANTFIATAAAVVAAGARPVFIDVDPGTLLMTAEGVRAALTPRTAAVIAVHLFGQPVDMDAVNRVGSDAGIAVIEDAAQAHGATWRGRPVGGLAVAGCFSFYPGKNLGAFGDAGAVVTGDPVLAERIRQISNHGRPRHAAHLHDFVGGNDRLDALQAAVLSIKLRRLDDWNARRAAVYGAYKTALAGLPVEWVAVAPGACSVHHLAVVQMEHRDGLRATLAAESIATGIHYPVPCHRQRPFAVGAPDLPVVERAAQRMLSLPIYPHMSDGDVASVADAAARAMMEPLAAQAAR